MLVERDTTLLSRGPLPDDEPQSEGSGGDTLERRSLPPKGAAPKHVLLGGVARRAALAGVAAFGMAVVLYLELWRCPVAELLGVPCPGCGLTRAALALSQGDFAAALHLQPLSPLALPLAA